MAKVTNPAFSLSAAGSINKITFASPGNLADGAAIGRYKPKQTQPGRSKTQSVFNERFKAASAAFKSLTSDEIERWQTLATSRGKTARTIFIGEFIIQHVTPDNPIKIPAAFIGE